MEFGVSVGHISAVDYAQHGERLGFARCWVTDSPLIRSNLFATLAAVALQTRTIQVGAGVAVCGMRLAPEAANGVATVNATGRRTGRRGLHFAAARRHHGRGDGERAPRRGEGPTSFAGCLSYCRAGERAHARTGRAAHVPARDWRGGPCRHDQLPLPRGLGARERQRAAAVCAFGVERLRCIPPQPRCRRRAPEDACEPLCHARSRRGALHHPGGRAWPVHHRRAARADRAAAGSRSPGAEAGHVPSAVRAPLRSDGEVLARRDGEDVAGRGPSAQLRRARRFSIPDTRRLAPGRRLPGRYVEAPRCFD
ncbi:MAG: LLM class flavin-dependent oxidoreductase [Betaproteobacteria bacterium]|nr:LLM class flavin-dependent oxidoreductase [Betaproteobacteria bacterium]